MHGIDEAWHVAHTSKKKKRAALRMAEKTLPDGALSRTSVVLHKSGRGFFRVVGPPSTGTETSPLG